MPALEIDVYWSFRSPWSYLATPRLVEWQRRYDLVVRFRPVYPIAIRRPEFFEAAHPLWLPYLVRDVVRVAEFLGLPFALPRPDPVLQREEGGKRTFPPDQPYIHRLTRLGVVAAEQGPGLEFANEVSRLIWGGTEGWDEGSHLADAAARVGLDLAAMDAIVAAEGERLEAVIQKNQADHEQAGHWGVPTCSFRGEPFFGQDRLDVLLWRLRQNGLTER